MGDPPRDPADSDLVARYGWVAVAVAVALSPGWATYLLSRDNAEAFVRANAQGSASVWAAAVHLGVSALVVALVVAWMSRRGSERGLAAVAAAAQRLRPLLLAPLLAALLSDPQGFVSVQRPILILVCAGLAAASVRRWPDIPPSIARIVGRRGPAIVTLVVATGLTALHLGRLAVLRHRAFHTRTFDLSIYDNILYNTTHGDFLACSLVKGGVHTSAHFDPLLAAFVPVYALAPAADTLIVAQLLWVLSSVVPVYLIAHHHLRDRLGATILALALLAYPGVHGIVLSDFHSLAMLAPVALWAVYALDRGAHRAYWVALGLVLLVREDAALFACGIGLYALAAGSRTRRLGAITIGVGLVYLAVVKLAVMADPGLLMEHSESSYTYANRYRRLIPPGGGARDGLATLLTNPAFALTHVLTRDKLLSAAAFVLPLGVLPLLGGRRLLLCGYGAAFCFLASHDWIYYPLFHYGSVLYPMLFAAAPVGMLRAQRWLVQRHQLEPTRARAAVTVWLLSCAALASFTMGSWVDNPTFALHTPIPRSLTRSEREAYAWLTEATAQIPRDAEVSVTNRVGPHLSNRRRVYLVQQQQRTAWIVAHDEDLRSADTRWVREAEFRQTYEVVARLEGKLRVLRRVR